MDKFESAGSALADFAIRRPVTIMMLFLSMLVFGILSSQLLPLEKFPSIDIPEIAIRIPYNDATPVEVEKMITRPVEEALATMSGIKRLRSRSSEDAAEIQLQFAWDENLKAKGIEVIIYEPVLEESEFFHSKVINDLQAFKQMSDVVVANRLMDDIQDVAYKVYTRDLFGKN